MDVISSFSARFERTREEEMSLEDYLAECKRNPLAYATVAERMLKVLWVKAVQPQLKCPQSQGHEFIWATQREGKWTRQPRQKRLLHQHAQRGWQQQAQLQQ